MTASSALFSSDSPGPSPAVPPGAAHIWLVGLVTWCLLGAGCSHARMVETLDEKVPMRQTIGNEEAFLKAHLDNGHVVILKDWKVDSAEGVVWGEATHYNAQREVLNEGTLEVAISKTALFETNVLKPTPAIAPLAVMSIGTAAGGGLCALNPKSCYGSCPTFYGPTKEGDALMAEGFSASVAPSLEETDVDSLSRLDPSGDQLEVRMTNEARETHVVRGVTLVAVPKADGETVYRTHDGEYLVGTDARGPTRCEARTGDCRQAVRRADGESWESKTDERDLGRREHVELSFDTPDAERVGLVLRVRQKFVTTFLFYEFLSNLGNRAVEFLANFERLPGSGFSQLNTLRHTFGHIEVQTQNDDASWETVGSVREFGPIARETQIVQLPAAEAEQRDVRLELTRGNWRIDAARLVELEGRAEPRHIEPSRVRQTASESDDVGREVTERMLDDERALTTYPGDAYAFDFELPDAPDSYSYFLASRGYYLEWIRPKWTEESNLGRAAELLLFPDRALRNLAPKFKRFEPKIEEMFWKSRYVPND